MAIYPPGKLNFVWQYLSSTLEKFKAKLFGYRTYRALLSQTGVDAPVPTVLENSLNLNIEYNYAAPGDYILITNNLVLLDPTTTVDGKKVEVFMSPSAVNYPSLIPPITLTFSAYYIFPNTIFLNVGSDDVLGLTSHVLEIRVYN